MTLRRADPEAAPPAEATQPRSGWRRLLDNEPFLYTVTFCFMVAGCLLIPKLLNNMIFVFVGLMVGVVVVPLLLKWRSGAAPSAIDQKGVKH
jgi:hypothetical protein